MNIFPAFKHFLKKQIRTYNHNPEIVYTIIPLERKVVSEKKKIVYGVYTIKSQNR